MAAVANAASAMPPHQPRRFSASEPAHHHRRMSVMAEKDSHFGPALTPLFMGISAVKLDENTVVVALAAHDTVYLLDYAVKHINLDGQGDNDNDIVADHILDDVHKYERGHFVKFIGVGVSQATHALSPTLCSRLWLDVDIVPIVLAPIDEQQRVQGKKSLWDVKRVDEQADSMARRCILNFGPSHAPLLQVGFRGVVQSDAAFKAHLTRLENHRNTCGASTWDAVMHYAERLKGKNTKIAFFSSTPQGGGVALMRHALVRFSRLAGVDLSWRGFAVPKPRPGVFRITKNIHNILQGVADPEQRVSEEEKAAIIDWITDNAMRYWLTEDGPLRHPDEGGADIVVVDDPQMPGLIPFIKQSTPNRPVLYRSHIQIRSDLTAVPGSPQEDVWQYLWKNIQHADMFISHPILEFVPGNVPRHKVAYMPATTDWLDGLNKPLNLWDTGYYGHSYNIQCHAHRMPELAWPARRYIAQVARFDPAKGVPTVVDAYAEFRRLYDEAGLSDPPQLCICGNGSVDDPDASMVFDQTMTQLETNYPQLIPDVSVMRLDHNDQLLNTILANAHVVLQLSTREGFEVKVSEALHAGRPVIATKAGGIPIQVKDGVDGFLVEPGDWRAVAAHLKQLFSDDDLHERMSREARAGVSDEVGTVGNALAWYYLAAKWAEVGTDPGLEGGEKWVNDMAREESGHLYAEGENRLPRHFTQKKA